MSLSAYFPVLIQIGLALVMAAAILLGSHALGFKARGGKIKDTPYESGMIAEGAGHPQFSVKFYVVGMLFILFDVEVIFLFPWALVFREFLQNGIPILLPGLVFLGVLIIGLVYELKKGALEWER